MNPVVRRAVLAASALSAVGFAVALPTLTHAAGAAPVRSFANCDAMHRVHPHGVGRIHAHDHVSSGTPVTNFYRSNALYRANSGSDRDGDGVACEAH